MEVKENCGVFGIYGHDDAVSLTKLGLYTLQHRGQESAGIVASNGDKLLRIIGMGRVDDVLTPERLSSLSGSSAIGHVRYSTTGSPMIENAQPFLVSTSLGQVAVAHNGNLVNAPQLRRDLMMRGAVFQTSADSELLLHLVSEKFRGGVVESLMQSLSELRGSYAFLVLTPKIMIAARDPWGIRPLSVGKLGTAFVVSSETAALDIVGAEFLRDVRPGEMVIFSDGGMKSINFSASKRKSHCVFELIYFAKPSSVVFGKSVYEFRVRTGEKLAEEQPADADFVVPVPDSGLISAVGFSRKSGIPMEFGLIRSHYIGRTFIEPVQGLRDIGVRKKFSPVRDIFENKRIVLIDDSIVRGTTMKKIVSLVRESGAKEIHLRISSPPVRYPCYYGIDFSTPEQLIANRCNVEEIRDKLGVDSVGYLSVEGLMEVLGKDSKSFCFACFNGDYPTSIQGNVSKFSFE